MSGAETDEEKERPLCWNAVSVDSVFLLNCSQKEKLPVFTGYCISFIVNYQEETEKITPEKIAQTKKRFDYMPEVFLTVHRCLYGDLIERYFKGKHTWLELLRNNGIIYSVKKKRSFVKHKRIWVKTADEAI